MADWRQGVAAAPDPGQDAGYVAPPQLTDARRRADGGVILTGRSDPEDRVRLSGPDGGAYGATADAGGRWTITTPPAADVRLLGLSEVLGDRLVQSEGYIALPPGSGRPAVILRAGGGALALGPPPAGPRIVTIDCDAVGGVVISGLAPPGSVLHLTVDDSPAGDARAGDQGRFSIALAGTLKPGEHQAAIASGVALARIGFEIAPPAPVSGLPYRGRRLADRWRIDWLTPGGGAQITYILD